MWHITKIVTNQFLSTLRITSKTFNRFFEYFYNWSLFLMPLPVLLLPMRLQSVKIEIIAHANSQKLLFIRFWIEFRIFKTLQTKQNIANELKKKIKIKLKKIILYLKNIEWMHAHCTCIMDPSFFLSLSLSLSHIVVAFIKVIHYKFKYLLSS